MKEEKNIKLRDSHAEDLVDHYWGSINHVTAMIKASELKSGLILSFYGILLNLLYQSAGNIFASTEGDTFLYVLVGVWAVTISVSIFFCVRCFIPRIEDEYDNNILFFGDVISKYGSIKEFSKTFYKVSLDEEKLFEHMGEQIFIISKIAAWKFKNVQRAVQFLAIGLSMLFVIVVYLVFTAI